MKELNGGGDLSPQLVGRARGREKNKKPRTRSEEGRLAALFEKQEKNQQGVVLIYSRPQTLCW